MRCLSCGYKNKMFVFRCAECQEIILFNYIKQYWRLGLLILLVITVLIAFLYFFLTQESPPSVPAEDHAFYPGMRSWFV
jgi:hypothetical protein